MLLVSTLMWTPEMCGKLSLVTAKNPEYMSCVLECPYIGGSLYIIFTGGTTTNYRIGLPIHNERQNVPICIGNESKIDDCLNNSTYNPNRCLPVLINCGTDDRGQGNNRRALAAAVTVPLLFVIFGVVAAGTIAAVFLWKKGLLQWESCIRPKRFR